MNSRLRNGLLLLAALIIIAALGARFVQRDRSTVGFKADKANEVIVVITPTPH